MSQFEEFQKIARLNRECVITEKIDGTNAQILIAPYATAPTCENVIAVCGDYGIWAGSRNRWLTVKSDNFNFAKWVEANYIELVKGLGEGRHYGEWWGSGIQRGYGLVGGHKEFSLFNTHKWSDEAVRPKCCNVVPVLFQGLFSTLDVNDQIERLRRNGSVAAPGFMKPEGVVVYHTHAKTYFKVTLEKDELPKSVAAKRVA